MSPPLAITQADGSRRYCHPLTAEVVPSVTSVLRVISKPNVTAWAARKAAEYALANWESMEGLPEKEKVDRIRAAPEQVSQDARDLGTAVHTVAEKWAKGEAHNPPKETSAYVDSLTGWLIDARPRFLENEVTLWSRQHNFAGTADAIAELDGTIYLLDYKTSKRRVYEETALQLSALAGCDFIIREDGSEEKIPALAELAAIWIRPRSCRLVRVFRQAENFTTFLACRQILRWQEDISPHVLGEPQ